MASGTVVRPASVLRPVLAALLASVSMYAVFLGSLTVPSLQRQVIYLHGLTQTWGQDLNVPEQWGFLHNQVTTFALATPDGETLHAWHILPLGLYRRHEQRLLEEPSGPAPDFKQTPAFELLRDDPESLLVLYLHGAGGTLGSGYRPASYRAASAGAPDRIHVVAVEYRGFGLSTGTPSEDGLLTDAATLVDWAMAEAGIPAHRIIIWGQSLGTAVATGLVHNMALRQEPVLFSGLVLIAPFADVPSLTATYRVAGTVPVLSPISRFPLVHDFLSTLILDKWPTKEKLAGFVRRCEAMSVASNTYHISIIHAQDDLAIPWHHSEQLFWHAVNASLPAGIGFQQLSEHKEATRVHTDAGGWSVTHESNKGVIREQITQYGVHDKIMGYPVVSLAVLKAFGI
ncbi:Alpha/Beta hydrolase protein [Diaporthe sp. PMI_573]|nr:Alpha/Beta hydrolase protein [Diaporthaceae sp. PMI_573]